MKRLIRTTKELIKEDKLPRWLKIMAAFGIAPIPGPVDEIILFLVAIILIIFYRTLVLTTWENQKEL